MRRGGRPVAGGKALIAGWVFATIQLLLALGIAWRPTVRVALGASIVWALGVWWFGEGLGEVLTPGASPVNGAPGAVIIYALLAVLLCPRRHRAGLWQGGAGVFSIPLAGLLYTPPRFNEYRGTGSRIPMRGLRVRKNPANHVPQIESRACADQRYAINLIPLRVPARQAFPAPGSRPARMLLAP
jgi:hypothetical protein